MIGVSGFRTESPKAALHEGQEPARSGRSQAIANAWDGRLGDLYFTRYGSCFCLKWLRRATRAAECYVKLACISHSKAKAQPVLSDFTNTSTS